MKLNHLNLTVTDVVATRQFLERYFGLRPRAGVEPHAGFDMLTDDNDIVLTLIKGKDVAYPATFHVGFIQPSEERVNEINRRMKDDGHDVPAPSRMHGSWTFYYKCPGGFVVEVLA